MTASGRFLAVRRIAWTCAGLVFAVTSLSAFVRLARAAGASGPGEHAIEIARGAHRVSASLALVLAIVALVQCYIRQPPLPRAGRLALGVVALGVLLAILGRFAGASTSGPVVLANLGGGFAMLALAVRLAATLGSARAVRPARRRITVLAAAGSLFSVEVALTALMLTAATVPVAAAVAHNMIAALLVAAAAALVFTR